MLPDINLKSVLSTSMPSAKQPMLVLLCLALAIPLPPAQGKGGFKCSAGENVLLIALTGWIINETLTGISKQICLHDNYSKFELPFSEEPNQIGISIDIDEVSCC